MTPEQIVVLDLWTDANRGDQALQEGLIRLLRLAHPAARISGIFRFGTNELERARAEIEGTSACLDEVLGGLRRTNYAAQAPVRSRWRHGATSVGSFAEAVACVLCYRLLGRRSAGLIGAARYRTLDLLRRADLVVWKGKNFRDYQGLTAITRTLTLGSAGWFASLLRREIHCINASAWPIRPRTQRWLYRRAFRRCVTMTVRDPSSLANARDLLGKRVIIRHRADLSFVVVGKVRADAGTPPPEVVDVALTVTAWGSSAQQTRYVAALVKTLETLRTEGARSFAVIPQVTRAAEDNSALVAELQARLAERGIDLRSIPGPLSISELLGWYAGARVLVGSRMHSCVFARAVQTPFVALSYDSGPKWEVLSAFWPRSLLLRYDDAPDVVAAACATAWRSRDELIEASQAAWDACASDAALNLADVRA